MSKITGQPLHALPMPPYGAASQPPQPAGIRVKGLEWEAHPKDGGIVLSGGYQQSLRALSIIGPYFIWTNETGAEVRLGNGLYKEQVIATTSGVDQAKAAAEADYRQRILSALEPQQEEAVADSAPLQVAYDLCDRINAHSGSYSLVEAQIIANQIWRAAHPTPVQKVQESQTVSEANEALMRERTSLIETKREQLDAQYRQHVADLAQARGEAEVDKQTISDLSAKLKLAEAALEEFGSSRVRDRVAAYVGCNHDLLHDALQQEVRSALHSIRED